MTVRSVLEVDVKDEAFRRFTELFNQYRTKLAEMPAAWGKVNDEIKGSNEAFAGVTAAILAQTESLKAALNIQQDLNRATDKSAQSWSTIAKATKSAVADIIAGTTAILRFASLGGALSGVLGAGGLWGLDRIAGSAGSTRRAAQGFGATYGEQQAFGLNFGRYVNTDSLLGGINASLTDPQKAFGLIGLGASQRDIASGDAIRIAADVLPGLKRLADQTPTQYLVSALQMRGLQGTFSAEDLRRLKAISPEELQAAEGQYRSDARSLNVTDQQARAWQDLNRQLSEAGKEIETVLVQGLTPLTVPLRDLSHSAADVVKAFVQAPEIKEWIKDASAGLEEFAHYIGTQSFRDDVKDFVTDIGDVAKSLVNALQWLNLIPDKQTTGLTLGGAAAGGAVAGIPGAIVGGGIGYGIGKTGDALANAATSGYLVDPWSGIGVPFDRHNVGNLKNSAGGFQSFSSDAAGITAIARQLQLYQDRDHLNTIREIESKYAPANENDTERLIKEAVGQTGYGPDQPLDLHNKDQLAALVAAITKQEGVKTYSRGTVVTILNQTGGNTVVTTSQLPQ